MKVARLEDVLQGKVWAYMDKTQRKSKRQKDLAIHVSSIFEKLWNFTILNFRNHISAHRRSGQEQYIKS